MIQLAWLWLRYQPGSELAEWFRKRVGTLARAHTADRHCGHGAQAVDCALALRRDGGRCRLAPRSGRTADSRGIDKQELPPAAFAGGDTGSATVFVIGGPTPPRFRWVASHRGYASCMRHYGAGPCSRPHVR